MSYDLYFCRKKDQPDLTYQELVEWTRNYNYFRETERDEELGEQETELINYENSWTGVYFQLEYGIYLDEWDGWDDNEDSKEYTKPKLYLRLNVPRLSYFLIETSMVMSWMCRDLNLFMVDTQTTSLPEPFDSGRMAKSWTKTNKFAAKIIFQQKFDYIYWPENESIDVWDYNYYIPSLAGKYPHLVPSSIFGVVKTGKKNMKLATKWLKGLFSALPLVDYVFLVDQQGNSQTLSYGEVKNALGKLAEPIITRRMGTIIIKPENVKKTDKIFEHLLTHGKEMNVQIPECSVIDVPRYDIRKWTLVVWLGLLIFLFLFRSCIK